MLQLTRSMDPPRAPDQCTNRETRRYSSLPPRQRNKIPHPSRSVLLTAGEPDRRPQRRTLDSQIHRPLGMDLLNRLRHHGNPKARRDQVHDGRNLWRFLTELRAEAGSLATRDQPATPRPARPG